MSDISLLHTPFYDLHVVGGAKMVDFAGYSMPVQYTGIMAEHLQTRSDSGLFDVSHMGQFAVHAETFSQAASALEKIVSADLQSLLPKQQRYSLILNASAGIVDDCIITRPDNDDFYQLVIVVNASRKSVDFEHLTNHLDSGTHIENLSSLALLAIQGPKACEVLQSINPAVSDLTFLTATHMNLLGYNCFVSRSGYTGEDGFEISIPSEGASDLAKKLLDFECVSWVGLGARDSLRLEAGLPLYGNELNESLSPVEANLSFAVGKNQRVSGQFMGATVILDQLKNSVTKKRVGLLLEGRLPARSGNEVFVDDNKVGEVTSGLYSPSLEQPIAMANVQSDYAVEGTELVVAVRTKKLIARVVKLPFVPHKYHRK